MSEGPSELVCLISDATNTDPQVVERVLLAFAARAYFGGTPLPRDLTAQILNITTQEVDPSTVIARSPELQQCLEEILDELAIEKADRDDARHELQRAAFIHHAYTCARLRVFLNSNDVRLGMTPAEAIREHGLTALRDLLDNTRHPDQP